MGQPRPFAPAWRRYCALPFPLYRHVPGETPHPRTHPRGHSYSVPEDCDGPPLTAATWKANEAYRYGVDLFNFAYWWEAHEAWEGLWRLADPRCALYLQGLIQIGAAFIKWNQSNRRGLERLFGKGKEKLQRVSQLRCDPVYMGLDLADFLLRLDTFFRRFPDPPTAAQEWGYATGAPLIELALD